MQANSQLIQHNQTVIPDPVLETLKLREGDAIIFEIDQMGVHLRKAISTENNDFTEALHGTLNEWNSAADEEAYADL